MRIALVLLALVGCATTPAQHEAGAHREAVDRLLACCNSAVVPISQRASCMPDVLAYCRAEQIRCDDEQLWREALPQIQDPQ